MLEPLHIENLTRQDLRNQPELLPDFRAILSQAADYPEKLQDERFFLPFGSVLLGAFHESPRGSDTPQRLVGAAVLDFWNIQGDVFPSACLLSGLAVRQDLQRQHSGIAPRLLDAAYIVAATKNRSLMWLKPAHGRPWLRRYYIDHHGFRSPSLSRRLLLNWHLLEKEIPPLTDHPS